jgi:hypothetical protein
MPSANDATMFVNFGGAGNAIAALGLFRLIAESHPNMLLLHGESSFFSDSRILSIAGLSRVAVYPPLWRRFLREDWTDILEFCELRGVCRIVNMRNEGPTRDAGYAAFKAAYAEKFLFFDLDDAVEDQRSDAEQNLFARHVDLARRAGLTNARSVGPWLSLDRTGPASERRTVLFYPHASQDTKLWPQANWIGLGERLGGADVTLQVASGSTEREQRYAADIVATLDAGPRSGSVSVRPTNDIHLLIDAIAPADLLISNDTAAIHVAAATNTRTVGIYLSTDVAIWGGRSDRFVGLQSRIGMDCPDQKPGVGNCTKFYEYCPAPCRDGISVDQVVSAVKEHQLLST